MAKSNKITYLGTGRRKSSVARVRLVEGTGKITINGKDIEEYFDLDTLKVIVRQPLTVTNTLTKYDVVCSVYGGGVTGQAGAVRHGIARALNEANAEYRPALKSNGFLTRDSRMKVLKKQEKHLNSQRDRNYKTWNFISKFFLLYKNKKYALSYLKAYFYFFTLIRT